MVRAFEPQLSEQLGGVSYVSTATVFLGFRAEDVNHRLDAVGFLVPKSENRAILACTFVSSKWPHRAPEGCVLLRVFFGGAGAESVLQRDDGELIRIARDELREILNVRAEPVVRRVYRFTKASPQPAVGHLGRIRRALERVARWPGLYAGGSGYVGTGIPDAVKQGQTMASCILQSMAAPPPQNSAGSV